MPKALFTICSKSGSEDGASGSVSLFEVVDRLKYSKKPAMGATPFFQLRITSAWMREADDVDKDFEWEILLRTPTNAEHIVGKIPLNFSSTNIRFSMQILGGLPLVDGAGIVTVVSRIRRVDDKKTHWVSQEYPIIVEEMTDAEIDKLAESYASQPKRIL